MARRPGSHCGAREARLRQEPPIDDGPVTARLYSPQTMRNVILAIALLVYVNVLTLALDGVLSHDRDGCQPVRESSRIGLVVEC